MRRWRARPEPRIQNPEMNANEPLARRPWHLRRPSPFSQALALALFIHARRTPGVQTRPQPNPTHNQLNQLNRQPDNREGKTSASERETLLLFLSVSPSAKLRSLRRTAISESTADFGLPICAMRLCRLIANSESNSIVVQNPIIDTRRILFSASQKGD